jgi:hypothetical protein
MTIVVKLDIRANSCLNFLIKWQNTATHQIFIKLFPLITSAPHSDVLQAKLIHQITKAFDNIRVLYVLYSIPFIMFLLSLYGFF